MHQAAANAKVETEAISNLNKAAWRLNGLKQFIVSEILKIRLLARTSAIFFAPTPWQSAKIE